MSFAQPTLLWLLFIPAVLLLAGLLPSRAATANPLPKIPRARLSPTAFNLDPSALATRAPRLLVLPLALACLALALARPQGRTLSTPTITESRDVLVAVDVSRSMLADDLPPNRLTRARLLIRNLADELRGERLGLLPFAGTAFLQCPLSADYDIFRTFLDELGPDLIPAGGSDFSALLTAADEAFGPVEATSPDAPAAADRYLIILSDGEAQDDTWRPIAQKLATRGVRVISLGLGTAAGAMVPDGKGGLVKDPRGAAVLSRLDASTLQELASLTDGAYRDASAWLDLSALLRETIARGRAVRTTTDTAPRREELFPWFLAPALALLVAALLREFPVTPRARTLRPPTSRPPTLPTSRPPPLPTATVSALAVAVAGFLLQATPSFAVVPGSGTGVASVTPVVPSASAAPEAPPADPLVTLVGQLASAEPGSVSAADFARLATLTADQGEQARASQGPEVPKGALQDALAAATQGAALDPAAADWKKLRARLEALLNPPTEPPQKPKDGDGENSDDPKDQKENPDQKKSEDQKSSSDSKDPSGKKDDQASQDGKKEPSKPKDQKGDDPKDGSPDSQKSPGDPNDASSANQDQKPAENKTGGEEGSSDAGEPKPGEQKDKPPADSKPLGDLSEKTDEKPEEPKPAPTTGEAEKEEKKPDAPEPEAMQRAGGVSSSGKAAGDDAAKSVQLNPALAVPQQRLDRVRSADTPARLYQLLQQAENPTDSEARAAGKKHDW